MHAVHFNSVCLPACLSPLPAPARPRRTHVLPAIINHQQAGGSASRCQVAQSILQAARVDPCSVKAGRTGAGGSDRQHGANSRTSRGLDIFRGPGCALSSKCSGAPHIRRLTSGDPTSCSQNLGSAAPAPVYMASQEHQPNTSSEAGTSFSQRGCADPAGRSTAEAMNTQLTGRLHRAARGDF